MKRQIMKSKSSWDAGAVGMKNQSISSSQPSQINTSVGESTTPIPVNERSNAATPEVERSQATELEDDRSVESILEALKWKERSDIWNHYDRKVVDGSVNV